MSTTVDRTTPTQLIAETSPLSVVSSSSPLQGKSDIKQMTLEPTEDHSNTTTTTDSNTAALVNNSITTTAAASNLNTSFTEQRSTSVSSDEFSDLTELDSETETVKMFSNGTSELKTLASVHEERNTDEEQQPFSQEEEHLQDSLIKEEISNQIQEELKENKDEAEDISLDPTVRFGQAVEEELKGTSEEQQSQESNNKRKLDDNLETHQQESQEDRIKKPKLDHKSADNEIKTTNNDDDPDLNSPTKPETDQALPSTAERSKQEQSFQTGKDETEPPSKQDEPEETEVKPEGDGNGHFYEVADAEAEDECDEEVEDDNEDDGDSPQTKEEKESQDAVLDAIEAAKLQEKQAAIEFLSEIEVDFAKLRDRLYEDKIAKLRSELEMVIHGSHPELQVVYSKIDAYREEKLRLAELTKKYTIVGIERKTRATRTAIHQQFIRSKADYKMKYLKDKTEEWYRINKERRTMDYAVPDYSYKMPVYTDDAVDQRQQVNKEIQTLSGLKQYYGFPTAPRFNPLDKDELNDDLRTMNIL